MAGQAQRGSRGHGRSSRPGSSSPRAAAASASGVGVATTRTSPTRQATAETPAPATRAVYRLLLMKGLTPAEAANLTAFMCGLSTTDLRWSLKQVNQLLFLRAMRETGRFGDADGGRKRPH